ncbi:hypothetical protein ONK27_26000, partial [Salmonella enterica subsp. enterica serovar Virginia]|nr:hypothetical protein [Salmonella enterica subsp. enterica serovar Virginia]
MRVTSPSWLALLTRPPSCDNNADGTLDFSKADSKISQYDLNAIEAACQLKQQLGDAQVVAM